MTLRGLPIVVCVQMPFGICATVFAWTADHEAGSCGGTGGAAAGGAPGAGNGSTGGNGGVTGGDVGIDALGFQRDQFKRTADCLATAHGQGLPLEACQ